MDIKNQKKFEASYSIDDGYVHGDCPQTFKIHESEINGDEDEGELRDWFRAMVEEHKNEHIGISKTNEDKFVKWAQDIILNMDDDE